MIETLTWTAYREDGRRIAGGSGPDVNECLRQINCNAAVGMAVSGRSFKVRIEDQNRSGCWIIVGPDGVLDRAMRKARGEA